MSPLPPNAECLQLMVEDLGKKYGITISLVIDDNGLIQVRLYDDYVTPPARSPVKVSAFLCGLAKGLQLGQRVLTAYIKHNPPTKEGSAKLEGTS